MIRDIFQRLQMDRAGRAILYLVLTIGVIATVLPFAWMVVGSIRTQADLIQNPTSWIPAHPTLENFRTLFQQQNFPRYFLNSTIVAVIVTLANLVFCSALGYALAKLRFRGKNLVFGAVMSMMMLPMIVTFIPLFVLTARMGLVNTYAGMILPFLVTPLGVFLMRQFISGLPDEIIEAGRVDGAGELRIFASLIMPLTGPALATLTILSFLGSWNNFLWPLVIAQTQSMHTLPVALAAITTGPRGTDFALTMAGATIVVIPVIIVYIVMQKYFTQGIANTGIK